MGDDDISQVTATGTTSFMTAHYGSQIGKYPLIEDWVRALYREGQLLEAIDNWLGEDNVAEEVQRFFLLG
ncbi:hypothetical protein RHMOL_Rhmol10G0278200 [Rhododendron molle]|uniref:Uncharacterized protein n=1 Tax=Rhododendron molle TaxID=49168 RepID=A0ACC0M8Q6_RHOML|nr:hypothetical protein RHMOL_Rhmol10G0278200 [Rhododendron molle]